MIVPQELSAVAVQKIDAAVCELDNRAGWRPAVEEFSAFFEGVEACPVCRLERYVLGLPALRHFHLYKSGNTILISDVDDVHAPGWRAHATLLRTSEAGEHFRVDDIAFGARPNCPLRIGASASLITTQRGRRLVFKLSTAQTDATHVIDMSECVFD